MPSEPLPRFRAARMAAEATVAFDPCDNPGDLNLRDTGFAACDMEARQLNARVEGADGSAG